MSKSTQTQVQNASPSSFTPAPSGLLQRKCAKCEEEEATLQRKSSNKSQAIPPVLHEILRSPSDNIQPNVKSVLSSPGQHLNTETRNFMESKFHHDFSCVRVHTDSKAAASAQALNAQAYTVGYNIAFNKGFYAPNTSKGKYLLAHELAHVIQQGRGKTGKSLSSNNYLEHEANRAASVLTSKNLPYRVIGANFPSLARQPLSLDRTLNPRNLSDSELEREIGQIRQWLIDNPVSSIENEQLSQNLEEMEDEVIRRRRIRRRARRADSERNSSPITTSELSDTDLLPRSLRESFDLSDLSPIEREKEEELLRQYLIDNPESSPERESLSSRLSTLEQHSSSNLQEQLYNLTIGSDVLRNASKEEVIRVLSRHLRRLKGKITSDKFRHELQKNLREEHYIVGGVSDFLADPLGGGIDLPPLSIWRKSEDLIELAESSLDQGEIEQTLRYLQRAASVWEPAHRRLHSYIEGTISGAGAAVTGLEITRDLSFATFGVAATIATGGTTGALLTTGVVTTGNVAQQGVEVRLGLRDSIDWAGITFDALFGLITSRLGGSLGNAVAARLIGNPAVASLSRQVLTRLTSDLISGRAASTLHLTARAVFDNLRGAEEAMTVEQFIDVLAAQLTDPRSVFMEILTGEAGRRLAARTAPNASLPEIDSNRTSNSSPTRQTTQTTRTVPITPAEAARAYANRFDGRLVNDAGLEGIFARTRNQPTLSVDRRAAAFELRQINEVLAEGYNGRPVAQVQALPPTSTQRTPDLVITFADGTNTRIEIRSFTAAPRGHSDPNAPLATATRARSAPLTRSELQNAIRNKATSTSDRFSQLDSPIPGVTPEGRIAIISMHKPLDIATADAAVTNIAPQLGNHVQSISIAFRDSATASRIVLVYNRQGNTFTR